MERKGEWEREREMWGGGDDVSHKTSLDPAHI